MPETQACEANEEPSNYVIPIDDLQGQKEEVGGCLENIAET